MTQDHHTPYPNGQELTSANQNAPLSSLDSAITNIIGTDDSNPLYRLGTSSELTISSGAVTITKSHHTIDTESDASTDDLDTMTIATSNVFGTIRAENTARTIVIKDGTGNILTWDGNDITLDNTDKALFYYYDGTNVRILSIISAGGGGSSNFGAGVSVALSSDVLAVGSDRNIIVQAESATTDDLIEVTGLTVGDTVYLRADTGDTITVKHDDAGATIKIYLFNNADVVLDEDNPLVLYYVDTNILSQDHDQASGSGAPSGAEYVTMALDGTLTAERVLAVGSGLALDDGGANGNATLSQNQGTEATDTLSSGVLTIGDNRNILVAAESGTADDLIEVSGLAVGETVWLRADTGDTITVKHNDAGATIKILLYGDADVDLDEDNPLILHYVATNVLAQQIDQNSGGGGGSGLYTSFAILTDEKSTGTSGGSASATTWNARDLNTEVVDDDNIVTIPMSSNQFTPIAGDYEIFIRAVVRSTIGFNRLRLYNVTGTATVDEGLDSESSQASFTCKFTANGTDTYRIDHYTNTAQGVNGLGRPVSDGTNERYMTIELRKLS